MLYFAFRSGESETQVSSFECRQGAEQLLGIYFNVLRSLDYCLLLNLSVCRGVAVTNELRCQPFLFLLDGIITSLLCSNVHYWSHDQRDRRSTDLDLLLAPCRHFFHIFSFPLTSSIELYVYWLLIVFLMIIMTHSYTALIVKQTYWDSSLDSSVLLSHDQQSLSTLRWESVVENSRS